MRSCLWKILRIYRTHPVECYVGGGVECYVGGGGVECYAGVFIVEPWLLMAVNNSPLKGA